MARQRKSLREKGQATVEFALVALIFFGLMCGIVDFGRGIWHYNTLSNATREGARFASVLRLAGGNAAPADCDAVRVQVQSFDFGLNLPRENIGVVYAPYTNDGTLVTAAPGACANGVAFPRGIGSTPQGNPYRVSVSATFNFQLITPIIGNFVGGGSGVIPLRSDSMMVTSF